MPNTPPQRSPRLLLLLFGGVVFVALVSLPWQLKQWRTYQQVRTETRLQEHRIAELKKEREQQHNVLAKLNPSADINERLKALETLARTGNAVAADDELQKLLPEAKNSAALSERLAGIYQDMNYLDQAFLLTRQALKLEPDNPSALLRLGYLEMLLGYHGPILRRFEDVAARLKDQEGPHIAVALFHNRSRNRPAAEKALRKAYAIAPKNTRVLTLLSQNLTGQQKFDEAEKLLDQAEKLTPTDGQLLQQRAYIYQERARLNPDRAATFLTQARKIMERCLLLDPNSAGAHFMLGQILRDQGDNLGARKEWEKTDELDARYTGLHIPYGQLLVRLGEREKGQELLAEGKRYAREDDEYNRLVNQLASAPNDPERRRRLARWTGEHKRTSRAILEWEMLLEQKPGDPEATRMRDELIQQRKSASPEP